MGCESRAPAAVIIAPMPRVFGRDWTEESALADGRKVVVRVLRPEDAPLLAKGFEQLSAESRFRRFHGARGPLTTDELRYLTGIDGEDHFALGAVDAKSGEGLGVGRFVRVAGEPTVAEPALAIVDAAQRRGLGRFLLARLAAAAQERGIESFRCLVLSSNQPMRRLLAKLALPLHATREGEVLRIEIPVAQLRSVPVDPPRGLLHELLVAAAAGGFLVADLAGHLREWLGPHDAPPPPASC